jgi:hypothetical protein
MNYIPFFLGLPFATLLAPAGQWRLCRCRPLLASPLAATHISVSFVGALIAVRHRAYGRLPSSSSSVVLVHWPADHRGAASLRKETPDENREKTDRDEASVLRAVCLFVCRCRSPNFFPRSICYLPISHGHHKAS